MAGSVLRVYADTSVFGGVFDEEFSKPSAAFFSQVRAEQFRLVVSGLVEVEIEAGPEEVQRLWRDLLPLCETADITEEAIALQKEYLAKGIVAPRYGRDAMHVAIATAAGCSVIVSWNFRHIVHWNKIPLYNAVNSISGYARIAIHSPAEVIRYEDQDV